MIGLSCPNLSLIPFDDALEIVSADFSLWEIVAELEHELALIDEKVSYAQDSYGMIFQVHGPISDINIGSPYEKMRCASVGELMAIMEHCDKLSIGMLTIHPGAAIAYGEDIKTRVREATRKSLLEMDEKIGDLNIVVALENMPPGSWSIGYDADELMNLIEDTSIGICFDIGHANLAGTLQGFLEKDLPITNLHLHNNRGDFDEHLVIDEGAVDVESILSTLNGRYQGNLIIEARTAAEGAVSKIRLEEICKGLSFS